MASCPPSKGIRFRDACGRSFVTYAGAWRLRHDGRQTVITYELSAQPSFDAPGFLLQRLLKRDARRMIEGLRTEIASRLEPVRSVAR